MSCVRNLNELENKLKYHNMHNSRMRSIDGKSNYKSDNDIFNIRGGRELNSAKFYRQQAIDKSEERIDHKLKV
jgi:hypothetical protein